MLAWSVRLVSRRIFRAWVGPRKNSGLDPRENEFATGSIRVSAPRPFTPQCSAAFLRGAFAGAGSRAVSLKSSASFSVIAPPNSSASTIVTARR